MPATEIYKNIPSGRDDPARRAFIPTPSDTDELPFVTRAVWVGTAGDLKVVHADDNLAGAVVIPNVPVGLWPFAVRQILVTGTEASGLVCVY